MRAAIPCRFELNAFREDGLWPLNSALFDSVFSAFTLCRRANASKCLEVVVIYGLRGEDQRIAHEHLLASDSRSA